jgi:hypothetical protein
MDYEKHGVCVGKEKLSKEFSLIFLRQNGRVRAISG